jgi:Protein of unknown function (DUF 659)
MEAHLNKFHFQNKTSATTHDSSSVQTVSDNASVPDTSASVPLLQTAPSSSRQQKITGYLYKITQKEQGILNMKLAKFIYSCNLPFNIMENEEFRDFVSTMRPSFEIPSHETIGCSLLNKTFEEIQDNVRNELQGKMVTLLQDGWSTLHRFPVIAHSVSTGTKNYFENAVSTGADKKTAAYCGDLLTDTMNSIQEKYGCIVIGVVTDNCNAMEAMRRKISQSHPELYVYGCNSHLLNLVGKDLTPEEVRSKVVKVQNHFRNHEFESSRLKELMGLRPSIPGDTRWNSLVDCFDNYIRNQTKYLEITRESRAQVPMELQTIIQDNQFYNQLKEISSILLPIAKSLDEVSILMSRLVARTQLLARTH